MLALALASTAVAVLTPWLTKHIIDDGLIGRDSEALGFWIGCMLLAALASAALGALNRRRYLDLSSELLMAMRHDVFAHLAALSPRFYTRFTQGELISRLDGDIGEVQRYALDSLLAAINGVLALLAALAMMLLLSPLLTGLTFILLPASVVFLKLMRPRLERETRRMRERSADISALLVDRLPNMRLLQSLLAVCDTVAQLDRRQLDYREQLLRSQMLGYWVATVPGLFNTAATAAVFFVGGSQVIAGELSLGALVAFAAYLGRATGPVNTLLGVYVATQRAGVSLVRVHTLLDFPVDVAEPVAPQPLGAPGRGAGELRLRACQYRPDGAEQSLWQPLDATIPAGARVWVSGASGAGKSTLLGLLQRHQDPQHGTIELDGVALSRLALAELRGAIVLLEQEAPMLDASVADNLRLGCPAADDEALRRALSQAQLQAWLDGLPEGLNTRIGHRGARLSGGERHRLALARALLRQPRVLLLDETTAMLDPALEREVWRTVDSACSAQTLLVVSHQRPPLSGLDHRLHLQDGRWSLERLA